YPAHHGFPQGAPPARTRQNLFPVRLHLPHPCRLYAVHGGRYPPAGLSLSCRERRSRSSVPRRRPSPPARAASRPSDSWDDHRVYGSSNGMPQPASCCSAYSPRIHRPTDVTHRSAFQIHSSSPPLLFQKLSDLSPSPLCLCCSDFQVHFHNSMSE